ncbi:MAG TPA: type VI secretion system lipoprotein TssJ [Cellvibrio sp.]|nr:type VI secretion system lipoprotein TssJ [Cellvibrio sp.]
MIRRNKNAVICSLIGKVCLLIVMLLAVISCSSSKSRVGGVLNLDTDLKLTLQVSSDINPDDNNRPSPVFVRFYQLKSTTAFDKADFIDIYERDKEVFGGDIVSKQTLKPLVPGETRIERLVLEPGTRAIAIYAEFSQYAGSTYKVTFPVTENNVIRNAETVQISGRTLSLVKK